MTQCRAKTFVYLRLAALLTLALGGVALGQQPAAHDSLILRGNDPLTIDPKKGAQVEVLNNRAEPLLGVTAKLVGTTLENGKSLPDVAELVSEGKPVGEVKFDIKSAEPSVIRISPRDKVPPGAYTGYLIIYHAASNGVVHRKVQLNVEEEEKKGQGTAATKPQPLVKSWNYRVYLPNPFTSYPNEYLPVKPAEGGGTDAAVAKEKVVGYLTGSLGGLAAVRLAKDGVPLPSGANGLKLAFDGLNRPGTYSGTIDPQQTAANKDDDVTLTVIASHHIIFPIIALSLGILIALWFQQRYLGVLRPVWEMQEKVARAGVNFKKAKQKFKTEAEGETYEGYTIEEDVKRKRLELVAQLQALSESGPGKLDESNPAYKKASDELKRLESLVNEWGAFAGKLRVLKEAEARAREASGDAAQPPFLGAQSVAPAVLTAARQLLSGGTLSLAAFEARSGAVAAAVPLVSSWAPLNREVGSLRRLIDTLDPATLNEDDQIQLAGLKDSLNSVWYDLWRSADFKPQEVKARLSDIHKSVSLLISHQSHRSIAENVEDMEPMLPSDFDAEERVLGMVVPVADHAREKFFSRLRRNLDVTFLVISFIIALNTGLSQFFYDKPFGTPRDYVNTLLWGFGTQTALSAFTVGLQRLWHLLR